MRFKYYLRGIGIGIIVSTMILSIAFSAKSSSSKTEITDEMAIERAVELGYTLDTSKLSAKTTDMDSEAGEEATIEYTKDNRIEVKSDSKSTAEETSEEKTSDIGKTTNSKSGDTVVSYKAFSVLGGQSSNIIAQNLYDAGIVDDAQKFSDYMDDLGVDNRLQSGTFYVSSSMTYDDLVAILVTKQQDRDLELPKNAKIEE